MMLGHGGPTNAERRVVWARIAFVNFLAVGLPDRSAAARQDMPSLLAAAGPGFR